MQTDKFEQALATLGVPYVLKEPLKNHTSFKIGGPAKLFCSPKNEAQLAAVLKLAGQQCLPFYFLGMGSNLLFSDKGYNGIIIHIADGFNNIHIAGNTLTAGAGTPLKNICILAQKAGLKGLEFAYGIPGSLGGAVYMNAGAYGGEIKDVVKSVTAINARGQKQTFANPQLGFGYRTSVFQDNGLCIVSAQFLLETGDKAEILQQMQTLMQKRADKQPLNLPSAGSAFKRPNGAFAGALIDQCGLRGYRVNGAAISDKHCGFIVNLGNAKAQDVVALANKVAQTVEEKTGFVLEKEIRVIGDIEE